ncbi:hypothetical protein [Sphingobium baderi]|uniref:Uncharacterized protein n=1 Tax=Sphingobium baderi TaxID=1332080 RepID=A0A0S3EYG5_9SPHN|nr:hypothetical protein [Sphingobium baderi]ALR20412.1 hypothetical protein ATN00_08910 [Sphingobium baderi]
MDRGDGLSRMLETSAKHKALPPLGRALDMRDSHPAAEIDDRLLCSGVSTPHSRPIESRTVLAKDGSEGKLLFPQRADQADCIDERSHLDPQELALFRQ